MIIMIMLLLMMRAMKINKEIKVLPHLVLWLVQMMNNMTQVLPYLLASPRVDLDTRDNRKRSEKDAVKYVRIKYE